MRKPRSVKGRKNVLKNESKFLFRKLNMTERMRIKSMKSRNQLMKGRKPKLAI